MLFRFRESLVERKRSFRQDLWGFQNNEMQTFMKLNFATLATMRQCDYALRRKLEGATSMWRTPGVRAHWIFSLALRR